MLGIGLGGFVQGFAQGYGLREDIKDRELARQERAEDRAYRKEQQDWQREERAFQQSERQRAVNDRSRIDAINTDARAQFDQGVESGTYKADEFEKFWAEYALPKMQSELILQNDYKGAQALADWSATSQAKQGRQLFAQAMAWEQVGNYEKAMELTSKAMKIDGYGTALDFRFEPIEEEAEGSAKRKHVGWQAVFTDGNGKEYAQPMADSEVGSFITRVANPQLAWDTQRAAEAKQAERAAELEDYETKKGIDARYSTTGDKGRSDAIKALRDRLKADMMDESAIPFDDMPREQQEKLIADEIALQSGNIAALPPSARTIVDRQSGQVAQPMPAPQPSANAPGLGESTKSNGVGLTQRRPNAVINGREDHGLPAPTTPSEMVDQAARQMVEGGNPQEIARTLRAMNVPEHKWPDSVRRPLQQAGN